MRLGFILLLSLFLLAACTAPSEDIAKAEVTDIEEELPVNEEPAEEEEEEPFVEDEPVTEPPEEVEELDNKVTVNKEESSFEFEGFGPGKSHIGTFTEFDAFLYVEDDVITGGEGVIYTASVDTGIGGLDRHLRSDDFFDSEKFPRIVVKSDRIEDTVLFGTIEFRGVTKNVAFPVEVFNTHITAEFVLDVSDFGFKYTGTNEEVRLAFDMYI